ncbi:hypothetical protein LTR08_003906 [Meristemomyces frigidus]|nr:hypothetical protein LTR08_003906 [Meristemomyces frigidus]
MAALAPASDFRSLSRQPPPDPDIHATLSDFLTYTEHLPSHVTRALTLIGNQRMRAEQKIRLVHDETTTYSKRPTLHEKPDPVQLRKDISYALEEAERACRMAVEEAKRLHATCDREATKLDVIAEKLKAQPMPPSRDPTPEQQALTSPNLKRERGMSTRGEEPRTDKPSRHLTDKAATKLRGRKIMVPGEVLPPPDPNAIPESISDWTSPRVSPPLEQPPVSDRHKSSPIQKARTLKPSKAEAEGERKDKPLKPRASRPSGQLGTNAHSAIAGISTSNALLALAPPHEGAVNGSKWLPWMKLTEWEMAKLRKRMKKNAIWVPSQTMVRRELKLLGRGLAGKEAARQYAEATGDPFIDEHNEPDPTKVIITGEESAQMNAMLGPQMYADDEDADAELINRGMRLNEAKKLKRQRMLEDQAMQAQVGREQGIEVPTGGKAIPSASDNTKKRKREATPLTSNITTGSADTPDPLSRPGPAPKKLKTAASSASGLGAAKVPLAPAGASSSPKFTSTRNRRAATPPVTRNPSLVLKAGKAVSEEPPNKRASLRRGSNASLPNGGILTSPLRANTTASSAASTKAADRRSRRPAPGILTHTDDGDAKVGVSKRKAAPRKRANAAAAARANDQHHPAAAAQAVVPAAPTEAPEEYVDPDEPRYCVCGDVSWGTMIACDNPDECEKEWFHLSCVGLSELPPRRTKWYCPDCRKRLRLGMASNGVVGRQQGR